MGLSSRMWKNVYFALYSFSSKDFKLFASLLQICVWALLQAAWQVFGVIQVLVEGTGSEEGNQPG